MKSKAVICAIAAFSMSVSGLAFAQDGRDTSDLAREGVPRDTVRQFHQQERRGHSDRDHADRGRGAGPDHNFYRGGRLPTQYRSHQYVVNDWRGHHLSAPPRGYQWVQTGGDYVLVAIATGIIASILLNQ
jgi:Ni/Co efflux regulator RcnB